MQLKYVNAAANLHDIQVPAVQVEPMQHGHIYEVENKLGLALLESDPKHWKEVLPKETATPRKRTVKLVTPETPEPDDSFDSWDDDTDDSDYRYVPFESNNTRKDGQ